eukprot:1161078-Pelagomonas_calceolata.AAC.25
MPGSASSHGIPVWWLLRPFVAFEKTTQSMLAPWQCTFVHTGIFRTRAAVRISPLTSAFFAVRLNMVGHLTSLHSQLVLLSGHLTSLHSQLVYAFRDTSPPGRCLRKLDFLPKPASCRSCMWTLDTLRTISSIAPELQHLGLNLGLTGVRARMVLMQCTSCTFHMRLRGKV